MPTQPVTTSRGCSNRSTKRPLNRLSGTVTRLKKPSKSNGLPPVILEPEKRMVLKFQLDWPMRVAEMEDAHGCCLVSGDMRVVGIGEHVKSWYRLPTAMERATLKFERFRGAGGQVYIWVSVEDVARLMPLK